MRPDLPSVEILGVPIARLQAEDALAEIERLAADAGPALVAFANANTVWLATHDDEFQGILRNAALVLNDGVGLSVAARMQGRRFPANLNGTDFTPQLLRLAAGRQWRVFLLGAAPGVADKAAARLCAQIPGLQIAGTHSGFFDPAELPEVTGRIRAARTDLLIAGMGNPVQEKWLSRNLPETGARVGVGVGAFIDFSAGAAKRAPVLAQRLKLEWLYRFSREPRRLWRRYFIGGPEFLIRVTCAEIRRRFRE